MAAKAASNPLTPPVLVIGFNRADRATKVMEAVRQARPARLYFACDGPRNEQDEEGCRQVRALVDLVDWECELQTRFSDVNLGVMKGPFTAMEWFFGHEEEGIILEDDVWPSQSFFRYCKELLEHYRHDERVWCIMGNNLMTEWKVEGRDSYYFSEHGYGAYWGWACWRRVWEQYDLDMKTWPECRDKGLLDGHFRSKAERDEAYMLFEGQYSGAIRGWDYQMDLARILNHGVTCIPNVNLARNIGFGSDGTHTVSESDPRNKEDLSEMDFPLVHPAHMLVDQTRDMAYFQRYIRLGNFRKFKNAIKNMLPPKVDEAITPVLAKMQRRLGIN